GCSGLRRLRLLGGGLLRSFLRIETLRQRIDLGLERLDLGVPRIGMAPGSRMPACLGFGGRSSGKCDRPESGSGSEAIIDFHLEWPLLVLAPPWSAVIKASPRTHS